jgi:hypothetical protein
MSATEPMLPAALDVLASTPETLHALLGALSDAAVSAPGDEGWSPKDVLAHLTSLNGPAIMDRLRPILEENLPPIANIDEAALLERSELRHLPVAALLDDFAHRRMESVAWLRGLQPAAFLRSGVHSIAGTVTVADIIHHLAWHDLLHLEQICRLLAAPLNERRGAMRTFT